MTAVVSGYGAQSQSPFGSEAEGEGSDGDQFITTFFCRALYDYKRQDASSLSFMKNDIIEVLTQLESGWWDGLLGDERGWFPSNYVDRITDDEAEAALSGLHYSEPELQQQDHVSALRQETEWIDPVPEPEPQLQPTVDTSSRAATGDYWVPQVTPDGKIFYLNTHTGQHAQDLPFEGDQDASDHELLTPSKLREGNTASLGLAGGTMQGSEDMPGFGVQRSTGTPEPWVRKLADDGMSYYYLNKQDGQISWTLPLHPATPTAPSSSNRDTILGPQRTRSDSVVSRTHSEDSEIDPRDRSNSVASSTQFSSASSTGGEPVAPFVAGPQDTRGMMELTSAERLALSLQQSLAPPEAETVNGLTMLAQQAISSVVDTVHDFQRRPVDNMDTLVCNVVIAVRNLLYVSAAPSGHIPTAVMPRAARDSRVHTAAQAVLKPAQRKVTATLSKLVLSARAVQYDSGSFTSDTPGRIETDAEELDRALHAFVKEVQRCHDQATLGQDVSSEAGLKRLRGYFSTNTIGLGLVGAGAAGGWRGFGWVSLESEAPGRLLGNEVLSEMATEVMRIYEKFVALSEAMNLQGFDTTDRVSAEGQRVVSHISTFLALLSNIHVARHVDIDGLNQERNGNDQYTQTVARAASFARTLEAALQSVYDDASLFLTTTQAVRPLEPGQPRWTLDRSYELLVSLSSSLRANLALVQKTLQGLCLVGYDQANMAQGDYSGSIQRRMVRLTHIDKRLGGSMRPPSVLLETPPNNNGYESESDDILGLGDVLPRANGNYSRDSSSTVYGPGASAYAANGSGSANGHGSVHRPSPGGSQLSINEAASTWSGNDTTIGDTLVPVDESDEDNEEHDEPVPVRRNKKDLRGVFGDDVPSRVAEANDVKPWFLLPDYQLIMEPDGSVKGGTVQNLVARLTAHDNTDTTFNKTFLMTYKSFATLDEVFQLLVQRFQLLPPPGLEPAQLEEWRKLKQHIVQMRVLNIFKSMVGNDDNFFEKEDEYIHDHIRAFISRDDVIHLAAAKTLMIRIERLKNGEAGMAPTQLAAPPPPIYPKSGKKLKLLDIDSLELARQLTILESRLYQKIKPTECLQRAREQNAENTDNIATIIKTANRIADWVAETVLSWPDSRRRAAAVKQFISVAHRCRELHNYSSMIAITSGLNTPPIRRLKRTWEQVNAKFMAQLGACEMTIDSNKNFNNYRITLASVAPPCIPFIGVFLTTLTFIQDGFKDDLPPQEEFPGKLVHFRKRQKASEVIQDIKRWQSQPHNLQALPNVLLYLDESLAQSSDALDTRDHFWNLSLEREPREREDEKMARLLQESGFL